MHNERTWAKLATLCALATSQPLFAGTILHNIPDSYYLAEAAKPEYAASGYISIDQGDGWWSLGSGTLIAPNWVLTAAHVVTRDVGGSEVAWDNLQMSFGQGANRPASLQGSYSVSQVIVFPGWDGSLFSGTDLALVKLSQSVEGIAPAPLYDESILGSEVGKTATIIGYQGRTGTGLTGNVSSTYDRRAHTNDVDLIGSNSTRSLGRNATGTNVNFTIGQMIVSDNIMFTDFDSPDNGGSFNNLSDPSNFFNLMGSGDPTILEGSGTPGDSGGGLFITAGGTTYLAGVTSFIGTTISSPMSRSSGVWGYYGDYNGYMRVSKTRNFIVANIPEPTGAVALSIAAATLLYRRRATAAA